MSAYTLFEMRHYVENNSASDVHLKYKGGVSYKVPRHSEPTDRNRFTFIVEIPRVSLMNLSLNVDEAITKLDREIVKRLVEIKEGIMNHNDYAYNSRLQHNLKVTVPLTPDLIERNDGIHSELFGMTMYVGDSGSWKSALYTPQEVCTDLLPEEDMENNHEKALLWGLYLNDPENRLQTLWVNIAGQARGIPRVRDKDRSAGLYIVYRNGDLPLVWKYYTVDQLDNKLLDSLGIFHTEAEAEAGGNTERYLKAENLIKNLNRDKADLQKEIKRLENDLNASLTVNEKIDVANIRLTNEVSQLKYELKIQSTVSKVYLEQAKNRNGTSQFSEFCKGASLLAGSVFAGYKLFSS